MISQRTRKSLRACIATAIGAAALGASYSIVIGGQPKYGGTVGFLIGSAVGTVEFFVVQREIVNHCVG